MENEKNVSKRTKKVIFWVSLAIFVLGLIFIAFLLINTYLFPEVHDPIPVSSETSSTPEPELPDNPIDFAAEKQKYPDIYAWINIPNTNINYPVVQHPTKDDYYLDHNAEQKYTKAGQYIPSLKTARIFPIPTPFCTVIICLTVQCSVTFINSEKKRISGTKTNIFIFTHRDIF